MYKCACKLNQPPQKHLWFSKRKKKKKKIKTHASYTMVLLLSAASLATPAVQVMEDLEIVVKVMVWDGPGAEPESRLPAQMYVTKKYLR